MTSSVKDIAKLGMRNPYFIEIFSYWDETLSQFEPFAIEQFWGDYKKVKEMNFKEDDEEVKMNELPTTLTNYYISVPNQNSKLSLLTKLLLTDCAN